MMMKVVGGYCPSTGGNTQCITVGVVLRFGLRNKTAIRVWLQ